MEQMQLSEATQEYLESIYWLYEAGIDRTQANLARALQVSQPSASEMLRRLSDDGLVSRKHVMVSFGNGRWRFRDQRSGNGVFVDGVRVDSASIDTALTIQLGTGGPIVT